MELEIWIPLHQDIHLYHPPNSFIYLWPFCSFIRSQLLSPFSGIGCDLLLGIVCGEEVRLKQSLLETLQCLLIPKGRSEVGL